MSKPAVLARIDVHNPADGHLVGSVRNTTPDEVAAVVSELRLYQPAWEELGAKGRGEWLHKLRDWLLDHDDEVADVLQSETGKTRAEARVEGPVMCDLINY